MIASRDLILILGGMAIGIWWTAREMERSQRLIQLGREMERGYGFRHDLRSDLKSVP